MLPRSAPSLFSLLLLSAFVFFGCGDQQAVDQGVDTQPLADTPTDPSAGAETEETGPDEAAAVGGPSESAKLEEAPVEPTSTDSAPDPGKVPDSQTMSEEPVTETPPQTIEGPPVEQPVAPAEAIATANAKPAAGRSLDELLEELVIPPPWLETVTTKYDTSLPWKEARLEIRRLLSLGKPETHLEAIKLMWIYHEKDDMNDHHEYPMYTFLGGEPVWSVRAHEWYLAQPHENAPMFGYVGLASLYAQFGEFERAKKCLDQAMERLPDPPWRIMQKAKLSAAYGDLYAAWGKADDAKRWYTEAKTLYPTAKPPYGGHLLPRRAADAQTKLDLLTFQSLATAQLRDGQYRDKALGYAGDINLTVRIQGGRIADIQMKHEEKIDQNACVLIPQRIIDQQSLQVDGVSGATVTKDAIVTGVYRCLKQAGLK